MILKNDNLFVTINNTIFRSGTFQNPQFVLDENALQGFLDGVNVKRSETVRPNQWGDFKEPGLLNSRHLSLTGTAMATDAAQLLQMRDEFTGLLSNGEYREISIQNSVGTRYVTVGLDGQPSWTQKLDNVAVWKLDLYAPDPRLYGPQRSIQITDSTISGGVDFLLDYPVNYGGGILTQASVIGNNGNTDSWPVFKVTGNFFSGFHVTDGKSKIITYEGVVTMSDPVTIDTATGTATQSGTDRSTMLTRRNWFSIPPNSSIQPMFFPIMDSVGWCDIMYRDTWI